MKTYVITQDKLEQLIEDACTRLIDKSHGLPEGRSSSSPVGVMREAGILELHDLRRAIEAEQLKPTT
jgi:hypothetical protein